MTHDPRLDTVEGRWEIIYENERLVRESEMEYRKKIMEFEHKNMILQMALKQYIAAINAPFQIVALEIEHGVDLLGHKYRKKPWWKFW